MQKTKSNQTNVTVGEEEDSQQAFLNHQQAVFDEMSNFFGSDEATPADVVPVMKHLAHSVLKTFFGSTDTRLMDVGCGTGALFPFYLEAAKEYNISLRITGVDLSPKMVALAQQRANDLVGEDSSDTSITVIASDFVNMMMQEKSEYHDAYDVVVANACYGNFLDSGMKICDVL